MATTTLSTEQQAEKRALKRLRAEGYAKMPSEAVLKAAKELEQIRMQAIDKTDTTLIQRAQLASNILTGYTESQKEKLEPKAAGYMEMVETTIAFSTAFLSQGSEIMANRGKECEIPDDEEEDDDEPLGGGDEA
jgi:hypothetical protein